MTETPILVLRTGEEALAPVVTVVMETLRELLRMRPIVFYELVMWARDPDHVLFGNAENILRGYGFVDAAGHLASAVRDVVLAATGGEDETLHLRNPYRTDEVGK